MDSTHRFTDEDTHALDMIRKSGTPAFLVLNKIDRVREKQRLLLLIEQYKAAMEFEEYIPISAPPATVWMISKGGNRAAAGRPAVFSRG